ncbi:hypothetical protein [Methylobacterium frigidaeris]|nr:hypothetical protein [Methylobacterium frigidaeris]
MKIYTCCYYPTLSTGDNLRWMDVPRSYVIRCGLPVPWEDKCKQPRRVPNVVFEQWLAANNYILVTPANDAIFKVVFPLWAKGDFMLRLRWW